MACKSARCAETGRLTGLYFLSVECRAMSDVAIIVIAAALLLVSIGWAVWGDSSRRKLPSRSVWDEAKRRKKLGKRRLTPRQAARLPAFFFLVIECVAHAAYPYPLGLD